LIAYSNLLESLPTSFSSLFQLVTLDLKKNKLESTKDALIHLSSLKFLDLRQNQLDVFPQLPRGSPLDQLFLGYNRLKAISPESILLVKDTLSVLEIRDNKLTHVPECLGHLCKIKTLELSNNELHDLPSGLGYLKDLNHVVLDGNPLRSIRRSILIGGCETLKKFLRTRGSPPPPLPSKTGGNNEEKNQKQGEVLDQPMEEEVVVSNSSFEQYAHLFRDGNSSGILDLTGKRLLEIDVIFSQACSFFSSLGTNLLQLNLSKNQIIHLPKEIALLKSLKV
jgi:Leucine-rich repeat (LRR) protein